ncbi:polysaccharide deacetylase family protein [Nannocystis punicea]|uniref:Polysaccharide deacetylase family protein n=1 Tax=Nannocystis punicea TaxID=2995304 RepID=A0ABY7GYH8_9BACT|nr:polysaccharide deacetylase family protein [Nannocystis poenicansa]WAS91952.1 polysaccharide deacetylase family protein [Nannocystis poenicansa]
MGTRIWMYHRVLPLQLTAFGHPSCYHLRETAITPEVWADDLRRLQPVIALEEVVAALEAGTAPPAGNVLTFDDGYAEWSGLVADSLRAAGATATFFVTTGMHRAAARPQAIDAYYWLLDQARAPVWRVTLPGGQVCHGDLRTAAGKRWLVIESPIKRALAREGAEVQAEILAAVEQAVGVRVAPDLAAALYMDETQWRRLARAHTLGAHGVTHRPWTALTADELATELIQSREVLEGATDARVEFAAYPDGAWDARVIAATRAVGYRAGLIVGDTERPGLFTLARVFRRGD